MAGFESHAMRAMCAYSRLRKCVFFSALDRRTCSVKCAPTDPNASGEAFCAVGVDVIEQKTMPISDPLRRQRSSGNHARHCGPAHPKKVGGLLSAARQADCPERGYPQFQTSKGKIVGRRIDTPDN